MEQKRHVHELLRLIEGAISPYTKETLKKESEKRFGKDACFTNCQEHKFNFEETIQFAMGREKIEEKDGCLYLKPNVHICEDH